MPDRSAKNGRDFEMQNAGKMAVRIIAAVLVVALVAGLVVMAVSAA